MSFFADILPARRKPRKPLPKAKFIFHIRLAGGRNSYEVTTRRNAIDEFNRCQEEHGDIEFMVVERLGYRYDENGTMQSDCQAIRRYNQARQERPE